MKNKITKLMVWFLWGSFAMSWYFEGFYNNADHITYGVRIIASTPLMAWFMYTIYHLDFN